MPRSLRPRSYVRVEEDDLSEAIRYLVYHPDPNARKLANRLKARQPFAQKEMP